MATWRAQCWLGSESGYQELEVKANTWNGAKSQLERIYGAEQIINLHQVNDDESSSGGGEIDGSGVLVLLAIGFLIYFWQYFLIIGGAAFVVWILFKIYQSNNNDY